MIDPRDYKVMCEGVREFFKANFATLRSDAEGYGCFEPDPDNFDEPGSMEITIGTNGDQWDYQTGDNSYTGGAYGFPYWGVVHLCPDSTAADLADNALSQIDDHMGQCGEFDTD